MYDYQDYLSGLGVISEEDFYEVIDSLPDFDEMSLSVDIYSDQNELALECINAILCDISSNAWVDKIDFNNKTLEIDGVESVSELEEIADLLEEWTITNYEDEVNSIEETKENTIEHEEYVRKWNIIKNSIYRIPEEELIKLVEKYDKE